MWLWISTLTITTLFSSGWYLWSNFSCVHWGCFRDTRVNGAGRIIKAIAEQITTEAQITKVIILMILKEERHFLKSFSFKNSPIAPWWMEPWCNLRLMQWAPLRLTFSGSELTRAASAHIMALATMILLLAPQHPPPPPRQNRLAPLNLQRISFAYRWACYYSPYLPRNCNMG